MPPSADPLADATLRPARALAPAAPRRVRRALIAACLAALIGAAAGWWWWPPPRVRLRLATSPQVTSASVLLAARRGDFAREGLDVELVLEPTGKESLAAALSGAVDLATVAQTPLMHALVKGQPLTIWATIAEAGRVQRILARRDRGIAGSADLAGKRIALPRGTSVEVWALGYLDFNGVDRTGVTLIDCAPDRIAACLAAGEADAACIWDPLASEIVRAQPGLLPLEQEALYQYSWNLAGRAGALPTPVIARVLAALRRADARIEAIDVDDLADLARVCGTAPVDLRATMRTCRFRVELDVSLPLSMEAEADYFYGGNARRAPFLPAIDPAPLRAVDPAAVALP